MQFEKKKFHFKKGENFCLNEVFAPVQREGFPWITWAGGKNLLNFFRKKCVLNTKIIVVIPLVLFGRHSRLYTKLIKKIKRSSINYYYYIRVFCSSSCGVPSTIFSFISVHLLLFFGVGLTKKFVKSFVACIGSDVLTKNLENVSGFYAELCWHTKLVRPVWLSLDSVCLVDLALFFLLFFAVKDISK